MEQQFSDKVILVSDTNKIISVLKGKFNNGAFNSYVDCVDNDLITHPLGGWRGITDWRLATINEISAFRDLISQKICEYESAINQIKQAGAEAGYSRYTWLKNEVIHLKQIQRNFPP